MASEISWRGILTGATNYFTIRAAARTMWNGAALEALTVANWDNYDIALTETPASSYFYVGTWPAALSTVGWYWVDIYRQAGAGAAISDTLVGTIYGYWDGTKFEPAGGDVKQWAGTAPDALSSGKVQADVKAVNGTAQTARDLGLALPAAAPGASGGLATTNGTKLNQTADLTAGQSIACSDKTGFSLAATGLDLVTGSAIFVTNLVAAIWGVATSALTATGSIGKKLADWVVGQITPPADMALNSTVAKEATLAVVDGVVDAIILKTNNLPASPAAVGSQMDLVNSPNATALTAIKTALVLPTGIKKNVAYPNFTFPMVLSSDGKTLATGKTVAGKIRKDGADWVDLSGAVTEVGTTGTFTVNLTQTEMNADAISLLFTNADCISLVITFRTNA